MKTLTMMSAIALLSMAACGGAQKTSEGEMSAQAEKAPPPPSKVEPGKKIERKVSKAAVGDFKQAVAFYNKQAEGGWTDSECNAAAQEFEGLARSNDKLIEAWFNAGVSYQNCQMTKEAEKSYQQALRINQSHAGSLANLGEIYLRGGNVETAKQYFEKAIESDGTTAAAYINLGWIYYQKAKGASSQSEKDDSVAKAKKHLQLALAVDNVNVVARVTMALVYIEGAQTNKNQLELAKLLLDQIVKGKPEEPKEGDSDEVKKLYADDLARHERNLAYPALWHAYGLIDVRRNNVGKALENFKKVLTLDPKYVDAHMNIASLVIGFRKYTEAEEHYRAVIAIEPKNYDAHIGLGVALRGQGNAKGAEASYAAALELHKDRPDAYYNMGLVWMTRVKPPEDGKIPGYESAIVAAKKAKEWFQQFSSRAGEKHPQKAEAAEKIKDCDEYVSSYQQAIKDIKQGEIEAAAAEEELRKNPPPPEEPPPQDPPPEEPPK